MLVLNKGIKDNLQNLSECSCDLNGKCNFARLKNYFFIRLILFWEVFASKAIRKVCEGFNSLHVRAIYCHLKVLSGLLQIS